MRRLIEQIRHMSRVKDCRHFCLFCRYFDQCKKEYNDRKREEVKADEHEKCNEE